MTRARSFARSIYSTDSHELMVYILGVPQLHSLGVAYYTGVPGAITSLSLAKEQ